MNLEEPEAAVFNFFWDTDHYNQNWIYYDTVHFPKNQFMQLNLKYLPQAGGGVLTEAPLLASEVEQLNF